MRAGGLDVTLNDRTLIGSYVPVKTGKALIHMAVRRISVSTRIR